MDNSPSVQAQFMRAVLNKADACKTTQPDLHPHLLIMAGALIGSEIFTFDQLGVICDQLIENIQQAPYTNNVHDAAMVEQAEAELHSILTSLQPDPTFL